MIGYCDAACAGDNVLNGNGDDEDDGDIDENMNLEDMVEADEGEIRDEALVVQGLFPVMVSVITQEPTGESFGVAEFEPITAESLMSFISLLPAFMI